MRNKGTFSNTKEAQLDFANVNSVLTSFSDVSASDLSRRRGHRSSRRSTHGRVMTMGLAMSPSRNEAATATYRFQPGRNEYHPYAQIARNQKIADKTFLRSATQATLSTLRG